MPVDPSIRDHKAWLGYLQPDGLVVSPAALVDAQVVLDRAAAPLQQQFITLVEEIPQGDNRIPAIANLKGLLREFLEWPDDCLYGLTADRPVPESLKTPLREFGETLEPTIAFKQPQPDDPERPWLLLLQQLSPGADLDAPVESKLAGWAASPTRRFERLMREAQVPIGLVSNATHLRLIYAPRGENSGTLTFPVAAMTEIAGRPILAAFHLLLSRYRLLAAPSEARLPALLKRSRDYQARVSTALAGQVLDALYELLRGFQAADDQTHGKLLEEVLACAPNQVYGGLLSVLMRLVFVLYAEDRGLMPGSDLYVRNYAVHGLFERLRTDAEQYPDTMEHRYGAWAQLLALFRVVHRGCQHPLLKMPAREGHLFDPERYPFLEGRARDGLPSPACGRGSGGEGGQPLRLPLVPDGTVFRILEKLLVLDGERLSYRTLDVEQIGSVYETMMGFRLELTDGTTIAFKPAKARGAPVPVNLEGLLATSAADRKKFIKARTDYELTATMTTAVKAAESIDDVLAALERRIARNATPQPLIAGKMVLMPTDERRKSGSHYTPRSLTEPIVRTTLEPVLKQLGEQPTPDQILSLKVCDPAMGSGAFLVEACRQLADALVLAWATHGYKPYIPPDEDEILHARRLIAQRCLYGVDCNPMAVDLAKLSLWLATLAKDHPFTFLDHSLRPGDSLVGLSRGQIVGFDLEPSAQIGFVEAKVRDRMNAAIAVRRTILEAGDDMLPGMKLQKLQLADESLDLVRLAGDAVVAAFFAGSRARDRKEKRDELFHLLDVWLQRGDLEARRNLGEAVRNLRKEDEDRPSVTPFHWEIEYPEVFGRETAGFDAIVGNPPFAQKNTVVQSSGNNYVEFLLNSYEHSNGKSDLVGFFFRRAFDLLRAQGCLGLLATNTIGQGDTREASLSVICENGGCIFSAQRRMKWPGIAAVVVSVVHIGKFSDAAVAVEPVLNGNRVARISAFLFAGNQDRNPQTLTRNTPHSHHGVDPSGSGFTFDDTVDGAHPISTLQAILSECPEYKDRTFPYIGGAEINSSPNQSPHRYIVYLGGLTLDEARSRYPRFLALVEGSVKPDREGRPSNAQARYLAERWWLWHSDRPALREAQRRMSRVLVNCQVGPNMAFVFQPSNRQFSLTLNVFTLDTWAALAVLQARPHELWARFFGSSMKDDLRYTTSDCFDTFPFPADYESVNSLELVGAEYHSYRSEIMACNNQGLTAIYNRFHAPTETSPDILRLRELHDAMDRAVLNAYGWTDIRPTCEFLLDYEDEEEEGEEGGRARARRKPWRYRWPDEMRDEVLARLLKLNAERAAEERRAGAAAAADTKKARARRRASRKPTNDQAPELFE